MKRTDLSPERAYCLYPWETVAIPTRTTKAPALITGPDGYTDFITHTQVTETPDFDIVLTNPHPYPISILIDQAVGKALPLGELPLMETGKARRVDWAVPITQARPSLTVLVEGSPVQGIMDTGADCSVVNSSQWKPEWQLEPSPQTVMGVGGKKGAQRSARLLRWSALEQQGMFQPLCLSELPYALWGRDVLSQLQLSLATPDHFQEN